ncbi:hypothetical protein C4J92_3678 [Pseudomonas sp. R3-18-08]|nr:hypothetical protein C4J92_3678 [Pseudomonas sp. R3-18-08]
MVENGKNQPRMLCAVPDASKHPYLIGLQAFLTYLDFVFDPLPC